MVGFVHFSCDINCLHTLIPRECRTLWSENERGSSCTVWWLFHPETRFPLPLSASLKRGHPVRHTWFMKEIEWARKIGTLSDGV